MLVPELIILKIVNGEENIYINQIASKVKQISKSSEDNRFYCYITNKLEKEGLLSSHQGWLESEHGRPSTKYYTITPKGSEYLKSQIEELSKTLRFLENDKIQYYGCNNCRVWK